MQHSPSVKVTIVKKCRLNSQRSFKSGRNSVKVTRVKSLPLKLTKKVIVENVDTIPTVHNEKQLTTTSVTCNSRSQSLVKEKNAFNSKTTTQSFESSSMLMPKSLDNGRISSRVLQFNTGDRREIYTIGKQNINKNKKYQLCQKCSLRYYLAFGFVLLIILGIALAVPILVVSSMMTNTITTITTTTVTTMTTTSVTTATTTSVTTATPAATVTITSNACTSSWMGITMIYHCDNCTRQYTYAPLSYYYVAIANVTRISFALRIEFGYFGIDDVSICDIAAPSINLLSNGGFETGNLSSWTHCVQTGSTMSGSVQSTSSGISYGNYTFVARSGNYYYLGGATVNAEYLSQTFSSIIGHAYNLSFAYVYVGNGTLSSGDFLLSI